MTNYETRIQIAALAGLIQQRQQLNSQNQSNAYLAGIQHSLNKLHYQQEEAQNRLQYENTINLLARELESLGLSPLEAHNQAQHEYALDNAYAQAQQAINWFEQQKTIAGQKKYHRQPRNYKQSYRKQWKIMKRILGWSLLLMPSMLLSVRALAEAMKSMPQILTDLMAIFFFCIFALVLYRIGNVVDSEEFLEIQSKVFKQQINEIKMKTYGINKSVIFNNDEDFREMLEKLSR
jgi:cation transport ATPase